MQSNDKIETLLNSLSLEQKIGQLNLEAIEGDVTPEHIEKIKRGEIGSIIKSNGAERNRKLQETAINAGQVPLMFQEDVIHGYKTITPIPLAEAASWDLDAIEASAAIAAQEASASGIHLTYAPMVDISRDPRWGRILEGGGEDPYLGSLIAARRVKGFQNTNTEPSQRILATVKHFAAYGASLAGRDYNIQEVSERELRETHLPPFKAAIDAGVSSIMLAYTAYDGIPLTANDYMINTVLREQLGFKDLIMTDWETISNLVKSGIEENLKSAAKTALSLGVHMDMTSRAYVQYLPELVRAGEISIDAVDDALRQVLLLKDKVGLLDKPFLYFDNNSEEQVHLSPINRAKALTLAADSMVLLKNTHHQGATNEQPLLPLLPLSQSHKRIAVIGPFAKAKRDLLGWWHGQGDSSQTSSIFEGLTQHLHSDIELSFATGVTIEKFNQSGAQHIPEAVAVAEQADVVILVLGEEYWMSGEGGGTASLHLPGLQEDLVAAISTTKKPIVSVIVSGRPYVLSEVAKHSDALIQAWMPGTMGAQALAEIISGARNPSAKLPVTFPHHAGQVPIYYNYKKTSHTFDAKEHDNRYSTTYRDAPSKALYPFGFGLSYANFVYAAPLLSSAQISDGASVTLSVEIQNTSKVAGKEIVQLYIHDTVASVMRPYRELKAFEKITLNAAERKTVTFDIQAEMFDFIGKDYQYTREKGEFILHVGPDSENTQVIGITYI